VNDAVVSPARRKKNEGNDEDDEEDEEEEEDWLVSLGDRMKHSRSDWRQKYENVEQGPALSSIPYPGGDGRALEGYIMGEAHGGGARKMCKRAGVRESFQASNKKYDPEPAGILCRAWCRKLNAMYAVWALVDGEIAKAEFGSLFPVDYTEAPEFSDLADEPGLKAVTKERFDSIRGLFPRPAGWKSALPPCSSSSSAGAAVAAGPG